jgi:hypothetical protein
MVRNNSLLRLNLIPVLFTTDGDMLITRGVGLDPSSFYLRPGYGDKPSAFPGLSLMAYMLKDIQFKPAGQYGKEKKYIYGEPIDVDAALSFIKPERTTEQEIIERLGESYSATTYYSERWATWLFAEEIKGVVTYKGINCDFKKDGTVAKAKQECWPFDLMEDRCLTVDEFLEGE